VVVRRPLAGAGHQQRQVVVLFFDPHLERDRKLFWLYYRVGLTADAIAGLPSIGLSTKGVESSLLRLTRLLRDEIGRDRPKAGNMLGLNEFIPQSRFIKRRRG
jgi:hypothetical protein